MTTTDLSDSPTSTTTASARRVSLAPGAARTRRRPARPSATLDVPTLVDIATGLAAVTDLWAPHITHDPLSRTSVRLLATEAYEVWLLGWTVGQGVDLHDHGGANAAFVVLEGTLTELTLEGGTVREQDLRAGSVGRVPAGVVHDVVNRRPAPATSLHVYSDPLRTMTFYEVDGSERFTEIVEEVPALVSASGTGRALHPAAGGRS